MECKNSATCRALRGGVCTALDQTVFPGGRCPFEQSGASYRGAERKALERLRRLGRADLIRRYHPGAPGWMLTPQER